MEAFGAGRPSQVFQCSLASASRGRRAGGQAAGQGCSPNLLRILTQKASRVDMGSGQGSARKDALLQGDGREETQRRHLGRELHKEMLQHVLPPHYNQLWGCLGMAVSRVWRGQKPEALHATQKNGRLSARAELPHRALHRPILDLDLSLHGVLSRQGGREPGAGPVCIHWFYSLMHSLVDSCMCPDWGSNSQPWHMGTML